MIGNDITKTELFCGEIKKRLNADECISFSGRVEAITAIFEAIQLGAKDCVYLSALAPGYMVRAILSFGAVPVFCDVTADGFIMDHRALSEAVRQTVNEDKLYPRVVIAGHFLGLPCSMNAVMDLCVRMGLFLIEDCGSGFGCMWDGRECGGLGDYSLISLGSSSVFGTGGSGCLAVANRDNQLGALIANCDGSGWDPADGIYADALLDAVGDIPRRLAAAEEAVAGVRAAVSNSDFWLRRSGGKHKSSCAGTVLVARDETLRDAALRKLASAGLSGFADGLHVHRRACFENGCRGFRTLENASALAPKAIVLDIFGAVNAGRIGELKDCIKNIADNIHL